MNFHGRIMNIQEAMPHLPSDQLRHSYKEGHRDARHTAAEIANEADEQIRELVEALEDVISMGLSYQLFDSDVDDARKVLAKAKGQEGE